MLRDLAIQGKRPCDLEVSYFSEDTHDRQKKEEKKMLVACFYNQRAEHHQKQVWLHLSALKHQTSAKITWEPNGIHMGSADLVLVFVTKELLSGSDAQTLDVLMQSGKRIIPILCEHTDFEHTDLATRQPLPLNRKPVSKWSDKDEAYYDIAQGIRGAVE